MKDADKEAKKTSKSGDTHGTAKTAQINVADRMRDLTNMRKNTLVQICMEERKRYSGTLGGLATFMKTEMLYSVFVCLQLQLLLFMFLLLLLLLLLLLWFTALTLPQGW